MKAIKKVIAKPVGNLGLDYDAIVIGAGISGLYQLLKLREAGLKVRVFEAGTGGGGTWYWNRYPGARFDSESYSYAYSFSQELLDEWNWSEHFASQPEILSYLQHVADKFDLLKNIQFSSDVKSAIYDEKSRSWGITLSDGKYTEVGFWLLVLDSFLSPPCPRSKGRIPSKVLHSIHPGGLTLRSISQIKGWQSLEPVQAAFRPYKKFPKMLGILPFSSGAQTGVPLSITEK